MLNLTLKNIFYALITILTVGMICIDPIMILIVYQIHYIYLDVESFANNDIQECKKCKKNSFIFKIFFTRMLPFNIIIIALSYLIPNYNKNILMERFCILL